MGFAGYNLVWFIVCPASNVCPLSMWALRAILFSYVILFIVAGDIPFGLYGSGLADYNLIWANSKIFEAVDIIYIVVED